MADCRISIAQISGRDLHDPGRIAALPWDAEENRRGFSSPDERRTDDRIGNGNRRHARQSGRGRRSAVRLYVGRTDSMLRRRDDGAPGPPPPTAERSHRPKYETVPSE